MNSCERNSLKGYFHYYFFVPELKSVHCSYIRDEINILSALRDTWVLVNDVLVAMVTYIVSPLELSKSEVGVLMKTMLIKIEED